MIKRALHPLSLNFHRNSDLAKKWGFKIIRTWNSNRNNFHRNITIGEMYVAYPCANFWHFWSPFWHFPMIPPFSPRLQNQLVQTHLKSSEWPQEAAEYVRCLGCLCMLFRLTIQMFQEDEVHLESYNQNSFDIHLFYLTLIHISSYLTTITHHWNQPWPWLHI